MNLDFSQQSRSFEDMSVDVPAVQVINLKVEVLRNFVWLHGRIYVDANDLFCGDQLMVMFLWHRKQYSVVIPDLHINRIIAQRKRDRSVLKEACLVQRGCLLGFQHGWRLTSQFGNCSATATHHEPVPCPQSSTRLGLGIGGKISLPSNTVSRTLLTI